MNIVIDQAVIDHYDQLLNQHRELFRQLLSEHNALLKLEQQNRLLSIPEACAYLGHISPDTLLYYRKFGLEYYKKGREGVWYRLGDIEDWLQSGKVSRRKHKPTQRATGRLKEES